MADLETVDVPGIEILSAGGPVHGIGSPPEGDFWTADDLEGIATANRELAASGELQPPNKIGHSDAQALLLNSGMKAPTPGEMPAVGWLDGATFRVEERDGVAKLLADVRDVPAKFADLLNAKAYRTRSVELSKVTSQEITDDQGAAKVYDWVVTGLAWLGAKLPAVRTLDDIVALYAENELDRPDARVFVVYATGDVVWDPEAGFQDLRNDVADALNGPYTGGMNEPRFWVSDIAVTGDKALVQDYYDDGSDGYVVPFTRNADDSITVAPSSDWISVEEGWVESARELSQRADASDRSRRHSPRMPDTTKYTDEQRRKFADAIPGDTLKVEDVTDEMLANAGVAAVEDPKLDPTKQLEADERIRSLEARVEDEANARRALEEERKLEKRDTFVESVLRDGKDHPGQREHIEKLYEANPALAIAFYADRPVVDEWAREYGSDSELTEEAADIENKSYEAEAAQRGIRVVV